MDSQLIKIIAVLLAVCVGVTGVAALSAGIYSSVVIGNMGGVSQTGGSSGQTGTQPSGDSQPVGGTPQSPQPTAAPQTTVPVSSGAPGTVSPSSASGEKPTEPANNADTTAAPNNNTGIPSTKAEIVECYNKAVNRVKAESKRAVLDYEANTQTQPAKLDSAFLENLVNPLIEKSMGEKELTDEQKYLDTYERRVAYFPIEGEEWASKLTEDNVENATISESNGKYTIVIETYDDEPSTETAIGSGNNGKAFTVLTPALINDNASAVSGMIGDVKTGHTDGKIVAVIDKQTGNIESADYYFICVLQMVALNKNIDFRFSLEKQFTIEW